LEERKETLAREMERAHAESESLRKQMEGARQQGESMAEQLGIIQKCMIIAMRIMNGDIVPKEDYEFLAEHDPELYSKAIMLRRVKDDPDEYDRLSEDEEETSDVSAAESGADSRVSIESSAASPAPEGGGAADVDV
jgi:hypothetical protein